MLGRCHREFLRKTHTVFHVNKVRNLEAVVLQGSTVKHQKLGALDIAFGDSVKQAEAPVGNIFTYVLGLKAVMYTMAMAGSFRVQRNQDNIMFAPLEPLLNHLAAVEAYILKHSTGREPRSEYSILKQVQTIDEGVRAEWARILRGNEPAGVTLGEAMKSTLHFSAGMFVMAPPEIQKRGLQPTNSNSYPQSPNRNNNSKGGGKTDYNNSKGGGKDNLVDKFDVRFKTCRFTEGGKRLCKPYNDPRGCRNSNCPDDHKCDYLTPKGVACAGSHPRVEHKGPRVPL